MKHRKEERIRWIVLTTIALCALAGCAGTLPRHSLGPGALLTGFYDDPEYPEYALLEYRIGKYLAAGQRPYKTICAVAVQFDRTNPNSVPLPLDPTVERKLLRRFSELSPSGECKREGLGYVNEATGGPAAVFDVHELECANPANCTAWGGYYASGSHGWGFYQLEWHRSGWNIRRKDLGIVLTSE